MLSEIVDARSSDVLLNPLKTLPAASEIGGASKMDLPTSLFIVSVIAAERSSDVLLNPVKARATVSPIVGDSASALTAPLLTASVIAERLSAALLNPLNTLPVVSEIGGASAMAFPESLLIVAESAPEMDSDALLDPAKTLATASDTVGVSVNPLNPVKSLPTASEIGGASAMALPSVLLIVAEIAPEMDSDALLDPAKTLDIASATVGLSANPLSPVKARATVAEIGGASAMALPSVLLIVAESAPEMDSDALLDPAKTLEIASATVGLSANPLSPVKARATVAEIG